MNPFLPVLLAGALAAILIPNAAAMPTGPVMQPLPGVFPMDCTKWKDRGRCAVLNEYIELCRNKPDAEWRECMHLPALESSFTPPLPRDCSSAQNRELCEAYMSALRACGDARTRGGYRSCVAEHLSAEAGPSD